MLKIHLLSVYYTAVGWAQKKAGQVTAPNSAQIFTQVTHMAHHYLQLTRIHVTSAVVLRDVV